MDITEYWPTLVSIILGLGVADLLVNLHRLIDSRKRVDWDPLPMLWAVIVLLWLFNYWWAVAKNLDGSQDARVVGYFVLLAIPPIILFLMAASVLPRNPSAEGRFDMRADWNERRSVFLTLFAINQSVVWVSSIMRHVVTLDIVSVLRTTALLLVLVALFFKSRRFEWFAVITILTLITLRLSIQSVH